ncbi:hypothetical protein BB561_001353 [Smittium simulii]|uniref:Uncharacterized protein n=1 Tax=Smittium simulii TaxID=133385 RepID=A0A2T9YV18_9FUNG|nr:hypothetical protein BB561_001353 [Smittium simulii]
MPDTKSKKLSFFQKISFSAADSKHKTNNQTQIWNTESQKSKPRQQFINSKTNTSDSYCSSVTIFSPFGSQKHGVASGPAYFGINDNFQAEKKTPTNNIYSRDSIIPENTKAEYNVEELDKNINPYGIRANKSRGMAGSDLYSVDYYYFPKENTLKKKQSNSSLPHYKNPLKISPQPKIHQDSQHRPRKNYLHTPIVDNIISRFYFVSHFYYYLECLGTILLLCVTLLLLP